MLDLMSAAVLSGVIYDVLKYQAKVTGQALKSRLKEWVLDDDSADEIANEINGIGINQDLSEAAIKRKIQDSDRLAQLMKEIQPASQTNINQIHNGTGDNIGRDKVVKDD